MNKKRIRFSEIIGDLNIEDFKISEVIDKRKELDKRMVEETKRKTEEIIEKRKNQGDKNDL